MKGLKKIICGAFLTLSPFSYGLTSLETRIAKLKCFDESPLCYIVVENSNHIPDVPGIAGCRSNQIWINTTRPNAIVSIALVREAIMQQKLVRIDYKNTCQNLNIFGESKSVMLFFGIELTPKS